MAPKHNVKVYGLSCSINFMRARSCAEEMRGEMWGFNCDALVFVDGRPMRGARDFIAWAQRYCNFQEFRPLPLYIALTQQFHNQFLDSGKRKYVYMDFIIQGVDAGRLVFELFQDLLPKTCANFEALCTGERGVCPEFDVHMTYANSPIHRVVKNGWIQGGDETFAVRHDKRGMLGMANRGRNTNQSQFYVTLKPAPWMDGRFVAFGRVVEGVTH